MLLNITIVTLILFISFMVSAGITLYSYTGRKYVKGQKYFTLMMVLITWSCFAATIESAVTTIEYKVLWSKLEYLGGTFISTLTLMFAINYIGIPKKGIFKHMWLFFIMPFSVLLLAFTNEYHHLVWSGFRWSLEVENLLVYNHDIGFYLLIVYSISLIIISIKILYQSLQFIPRSIKRQTWILMFGFSIPLFFMLFYALGINFTQGLDLAIMSFALTGPVTIIGITKFGMFKILPSVSTEIADLINDGILALDENNEIVFVNSAASRITGVNEKNLIYRNVKQVEWLSGLDLDKNQKRNIELEVMIQADPEKWILINVNDIKNDDGLFKGTLLLIHDITNRKRLEQQTRNLLDELSISNGQMKEANIQKDKILSIIAHDLRTPFHQISNLTSLLTACNPDLTDLQFRTFINDIYNASEQGSSILEELIAWARLHQKRVTSNIDSFNAISALESVIESLSLSLKDKNLDIELIGDSGLQISTDSNVFNFVVRNLLANAVKFSNPSGKIVISLELIDGHHMVKVIDNGVGIPDDDLSKVFNSKVKYSQIGTIGEKGSGIGLLLCKEMIERIDASLEFESKEGVGSTFSIILGASKHLDFNNKPL